MSISITEAHQVIGILLAEIRKLNKEVARAESQRIDVFTMGCREHARGLVEGNRFPMYCAVCGKPHTTTGDDPAWTHKELRESLSSVTEVMKMYKDELDHHALFLRRFAGDLRAAIKRGGLSVPRCEELIKQINQELDYEGT